MNKFLTNNTFLSLAKFLLTVAFGVIVFTNNPYCVLTLPIIAVALVLANYQQLALRIFRKQLDIEDKNVIKAKKFNLIKSFITIGGLTPIILGINVATLFILLVAFILYFDVENVEEKALQDAVEEIKLEKIAKKAQAKRKSRNIE